MSCVPTCARVCACALALAGRIRVQAIGADAGYALLQVKEKFGGLRYYTQESDDLTVEGRERCAALIDEAERRSASTCETCGGSGSLHTNARRWFRTLCAGHAEESGYTKVAPAERDS